VTARTRLTILYTGLVLAAGALMTGITYVLMGHNLSVRIQLLPNSTPPPLPDLRRVTLAEFLGTSAVALAMVTVVAAGLTWLIAGRVLRPIRTITATAQRLSAANLSDRVPVIEPADELGALATTINGMLDRIEQVLHSQRMFTANAAHELRTPLTTIRTAVDVALDDHPELAGDITAAVDRSQRTLDGLLALARSQAGVDNRSRVDLAQVVTAVLAATDTRGLAVRTDLRPALVRGEPVLLELLAKNLVENAVRYNVPGGEIEVSTGPVFLRVRNTGPVVAAADRLVEPFVRGEGAHGIGLGLSIVQAVATAHRGEITVVARPAGGLDVRLAGLPGS
jgi:signal transduction histidine kinase